MNRHGGRDSEISLGIGCVLVLAKPHGGLLISVIDHVIPAPAAVGRQVGLNAVPHCRGHDLGRQVADHVGPVGVAVPTGVGNEFLALGLVVLPDLVPERPSVQVLPDVVSCEAHSHGWEPVGGVLLGELPLGGPVITGQQPQGAGLGLAA